jgi:tetratricopeptide (TPR) repeat protein
MKRISLLLIAGVVLMAVRAPGQVRADNGRELLKEGKALQAAAFYQAQIQNSSRDFQAWYGLGLSYEKLGKLDSAEIAAQRAVTINDELSDGWVLLVRVQSAQKNFAGAHVSARTGLKAKKQEYPPLLIAFGSMLMKADSADAALVVFSRAKELDPNSAVAYIGMGDAYLKQGVGPMATAQYEKSLELDSSQIDLLYKLANVYVKERQYPEAGRTYNRLLAIQPNNDNARLELGRLYYRAKLWSKCAATLKDYFTRVPNPPKELLSNYMEALYSSRQYKEALPVAEKFVQADPKSVLGTRILAVSQYESKQYALGVENFTKLGTMDTLTFDDLRRLGRAYHEVKKDSLAAVTLERALKIDTTQAAIYGEAGSYWMIQKSWARAAVMLEKRFLIDTAAIGALINYGACMMQMEEYDKAASAYERAIRQNPQYPPAYVHLASCYLQDFVQLKQQDKAADGHLVRQTAEKAIQVVDTAKAKWKLELVDAYRMIGLSYLLEKKWEEGVKNLRESLKLRDDEAQTWLLLGQGLQNLQKNKEAYDAYKRVLKIDPKNPAALKGVETLKPLVE